MMPRFAMLATACMLPALLLSNATRAATIFSNLGSNPVYDTQVGTLVGDDATGNNDAEGATFTPTATATLGQIQIALACNNASCPDPYTVSLTADNGFDAPGTVIESFTGSGTLLGSIGNDNPLVVFESILFPVLTASTQYWLTVSTDLNDLISWNYNTGNDASDTATSFDGGSTYLSPSFLTPGAYEVDNNAQPVPEPGSWWVLAGGAAILATSRLASRRGVKSIFA